MAEYEKDGFIVCVDELTGEATVYSVWGIKWNFRTEKDALQWIAEQEG